MDSLSSVFLLDSLFSSPLRPSSEINFRAGYNNNTVSLGRNYGINQQSIYPGIAFYHKSGVYMNYTGFINTQTTPAYNLTMLSAGYMAPLGAHWNYNMAYEHWFFSQQNEDNPLNNSADVSGSYNTRYGYATVDYSLLFGNEIAHRLMLSITGKLQFKQVWIFQSIRILPSFNMIFGTEDVTLYRFSASDRNHQLLYILRLKKEELQKLYQEGAITRDELREFLSSQRLASTGSLSQEQETRLEEILNDLMQHTTTFGLMDYNFSIPVTFSTRSFSFTLNYTYSIPVPLPDENYAMDPIGYFGASVAYRLRLKD